MAMGGSGRERRTKQKYETQFHDGKAGVGSEIVNLACSVIPEPSGCRCGGRREARIRAPASLGSTLTEENIHRCS